jgi:hypothetical protein
LVIGPGYGTTHENSDIYSPFGFELSYQVASQSFMPVFGAQKTNQVYVIFDCHPGGTPGRPAQRADVNIKPRFSKDGGQQSGVMIMAFLVHTTDQDTGSPPFPFDELFDSLLD